MAQEYAVMTEEMVDDIRRRIGIDWQPREPLPSRQEASA